MSTRCNVLIEDEYDKQWFYRHSDGYPKVTATSLKTFIKWLTEGRIRDNVLQGASWLIIIGNTEYDGMKEPVDSFYGWKVGAYELTSDIHGDIEYLYKINLKNKTVKIKKIGSNSQKEYSYEEFLSTDFTGNDQF